ncbi:MAG: MIP/aquaporin family protein [Gammaproteobacteria bacterium]
MAFLIGEFLGTMTLCIFGCGVVANTLLGKSKGSSGAWIAITTGWAMAVLMGVFVAQATGGAGDINPAVSLAKHLLGFAYPTFTQLSTVMLAQLLGGLCGGIFVWLVYYPHWAATPDASHKLAVFCTEPAIRRLPFNFLTELLATLVLVLGVGAISTIHAMQAMPSGLSAYFVALLVWGIGLSLGGPTGYAINPARDLGPRLAHALLPIPQKRDSDWAYAWVPVFGPLVGAAIGAGIWSVVF